MSSQDNKGFCPHCMQEGEDFFVPCPDRGCSANGYHLIPMAFLPQNEDEKSRFLDQRIGLVLVGKYLLVRRIGEGGMGAVYIALQRPIMREVAVKLLTTVKANEELKKRFFREAKAMAMIDHPNVVRLYDFDFVVLDGRDSPFIVMELLNNGISLRQWFNEKGNSQTGITLQDVESIFSQVLKGLNAAHKTGLIHRDIKPENIMVLPLEDNQVLVKILDFGLAKAMEAMEGFNVELSQAGSILGSPHYMAPEQTYFAQRGQVVTPKTDLYAVGVMLFEVFTGKRPFTGQNHKEIIWKKVDAEYDPLALPEAALLPQGLRSFLAKAMAMDPDARFPDAMSMLAALREVMVSLDTNTAPAGLSPHSSYSSSKPIEAIKVHTTPPPAAQPTQPPSPVKPATSPDEELPYLESADFTPGRGHKTWWLAGLVLLLAMAGAFFMFNSHHSEKNASQRHVAGAVQHVDVPAPTVRREALGISMSGRRPAILNKIIKTHGRKPKNRKNTLRKKKKTDMWL